MRNTWLVARREYLERVRTKAFIVSTILIPALMASFTIFPTMLASRKSTTAKHIAVIASSQAFGEAVRGQIIKRSDRAYTIDVQTDSSDSARNALKARIGSGSLDGFLVATDDDLAKHKLTFAGRETGDFIEAEELRSAVYQAQLRSRLGAAGVSSQAMDDMLKSFSIDTVRIQQGKESKTSGMAAFFSTLVFIILLYTTLIMYGVSVMRAVVEEKNSRIVEVMLASVTPKELMAGKIIGVGAAGVTQMAIWAVAASALGSMGAIGMRMAGVSLSIEPRVLIFLPVFFLLGFLLYSTAFAALGAAVNNEQEAQQLQLIVMLPLIIAISSWFPVLREPDSMFAHIVSLVPFTSPIMMYLRLVVSQPSPWEVAASIAILLLTIYGMIALCARIYRVGILMYGKKPTLPEIIRWLKYA